ncbi:unnamed protein product, partial [Dracunculus medinensis]|uniref:MAM domain-containing protein n=1 Tax=Dracunculus medinensis TaxID=318479 RepID=A0A0N4UDC1_DRAME
SEISPKSVFIEFHIEICLISDGGRIESLIDTDDLRCSDFDESCQWYNIENSELSWLRGRIHLDSQHMKIAAGTEIVPKGLYAVVVTDRQMFPNAKAVLASKVIECQQGIGQLRLNYWVSTGVRISVCAKRTGKRYPDFDICTDLDPGNIPGPAYVNIQDFEHQPFQIFIRANNFIYDSASLKGGFAIVDNIEYYADLCTNSLDKVPQEVFIFQFIFLIFFPEVSFLYIIGPIATSRLLIPSFTSAFNFHLILTYNVHPKSSKLRAYAKLLNEAHERKIFQVKYKS